MKPCRTHLPTFLSPEASLGHWLVLLCLLALGLSGLETTTRCFGGIAANGQMEASADVSLDATFEAGAGWRVCCLGTEGAGNILVGGFFNNLCGVARPYFGRLRPDGTLDSDFTASPNNSVLTVAVQDDGNILVAGTFTSLSGEPRTGLARLAPNGTLDRDFKPEVNLVPNSAPPSPAVSCLAVQADGRIVVAGTFTHLCGQPRAGLGRLKPDGTLDGGFDPNPSGSVFAVITQPDGKILVAGLFTNVCNQPRMGIARLYPDGSLDSSFNPMAPPNQYALALQPDGRIIAGGSFQTMGGQPRKLIARLDPDGKLDDSFNPGEAESC